jgi:aromatic ring-opening dioxygenase LigB subunit
VPSKNTAKFSSTVIELLKNTELQKIFSINGKNIFNQKFSSYQMTRKYESLYLREERH